MYTSNIMINFILMMLMTTSSMAAYNVLDFGAKPDGKTDSAKPFVEAWAAACGGDNPSTVYVPAGVFYVSQALFQGPCGNADIKVLINGTIVASSKYSQVTRWLTFNSVDGLSIYGGTIDGRGQSFWNCKLAGRSCPSGAASLTIAQSKNVLISSLTSLNSKLFHVSIYGSTGVTVEGATILAPANSPNTDGIHVQMSSQVTITGATIETGDDCVSMGPGSVGVLIEHVQCGPGHGISIGSLGSTPNEAGVENIAVKAITFTGTQNGLRIKTWAEPYRGYVKGVTFQNVVMENVKNPIIIDQNYCVDDKDCPNQSSGIAISNISYDDIQGSSATDVAVNFDCSVSNPCRNIGMQDVNLTYEGKVAQSFCRNVQGTASGIIIPPSCF